MRQKNNKDRECQAITEDFKSPFLYLIKSKSSDQDTRCSIHDKFLHFLTYKKYFFIQGQISNLITARPMASPVLTLSNAFSLSPISGGSSKRT